MLFGFRGAGAFLRILSSASLLFALKSGCLNSHACSHRQYPIAFVMVMQNALTYTRAVRRSAVLLIIMPHFVEVVFVQLSHETGKVAVLEVLWEDVFGEFLVLSCGQQCGFPRAPDWRIPTSSTTKLSPSLPQRTTLSSCGLSSILCTMSVTTCRRAPCKQYSLVQLADLRGMSARRCAICLASTYKVAGIVGALTAVHVGDLFDWYT